MIAFHVKRVLSTLVLAPIRVYQRLLSPLLPARCRYYPTCSQYAVEAVRELGPFRGGIVAAWRLARCNPWSDGGLDPLSERTIFRPRRAGAGSAGACPQTPDAAEAPFSRSSSHLSPRNGATA